MEPNRKSETKRAGARAVEKPSRGKVQTQDFSTSLGNPQTPRISTFPQPRLPQLFIFYLQDWRTKTQTRPRQRLTYPKQKMVLTMGSTLFLVQIRRPSTDVASSVFWSLICVSLLFSAAKAQQPVPNAPSAQKVKTHATGASESSWPRTFTSGTDTFTIYQPQVDKWDENLINVYCAVELKAGKESAAKYGVVWFQALTEVDKVNRLVTLDQAKVTKVKFPVAQDKESELTALLEKKLPGATKTISLDRLEAALDVDSETFKGGVGVKNDPPHVIIASKPSLLVLIDGSPQTREVDGTKLLRVINTRSIIFCEADKELYFLRVQDWWLQAKKLEGPWEYAKKLPDDMKKAEELVASQNQVQDSAGVQLKQQPSLKPAGKKAE